MFYFTMHQVAGHRRPGVPCRPTNRKKNCCSIWVVPPGIENIRGCRIDLELERVTAFDTRAKGTIMGIHISLGNRRRNDRYDRHDRYDRSDRYDRYDNRYRRDRYHR